LKDPQAVPALLEALKDEDETPVRLLRFLENLHYRIGNLKGENNPIQGGYFVNSTHYANGPRDCIIIV
jgi:hypothetical protein